MGEIEIASQKFSQKTPDVNQPTHLVYPDKVKVQLRQTTHKMDVFGVNLALRYQTPGAAMHDPRDKNGSGSANSPRFELSHVNQPNGAPLAEQCGQPLALAQFQARYPMGSLTADLLDIRGDNYIVKASVQVGGNVLATGMAVATSIEAAEDRARLRALEVLGIQAPQPPQPTASSAYEVQVQLMTNHQSEAEFSPQTRLAHVGNHQEVKQLSAQQQRPLSVASTALEMPAIVPEPASTFSGDFSGELFNHTYTDSYTDIDIDTAAIAEPVIPSHPEVQPTSLNNGRNGKSAVKAREVVPEPATREPSREPMDLSEAIAQTSVEIKRLGWTDVQGRTHLQRTYGKRSRQHLTDEELLEFLEYLRSQPSPNESPF
ncbi:hypothetical protein NDA01_10560 [Trichocoleus desertorum AS-A10]|uniref:hypothetical protein n=1 Tax=Trichocoleus desertorum TaxID=1481672 RepID=UPI0032997983